MTQRIQNMFKQEKGLTLIELLAVIVVLGIIAAIAVPSISGLIEGVEEDGRAALAHQIYEAGRLYLIGEESNATTVTLAEMADYIDNIGKDPGSENQIGDTTVVDFTAGTVTVFDNTTPTAVLLYTYNYNTDIVTP
ncbi:prepilin-type N-terminal cleavage/methylation domain-containing protein [Chengkuizengella sediminis]|uniref:prepilin-type N-terminal cleavage/methylation domain-containing protein n=1 Tax=Chengkuizengella sediminis TaxID=1885917 RepID=UPI00138A3623|nr:prepilin-type N-terminal cleavage/methylation domain-containing protein [Chengkuizengella sediminis]NDI35404.1 prepilin-type N-terminal cleavage/methylation domain-containing protein [Chengkuizengella sediminis]